MTAGCLGLGERREGVEREGEGEEEGEKEGEKERGGREGAV